MELHLAVSGWHAINDCKLATTTNHCELPGVPRGQPSTELTPADRSVISVYPWVI
jgi:hypothetical protein